MSDAEWAFFAPFLIESRSRGGRRPQDHRRVPDGIFWTTRTGSPWRDLPDAFGNWNSVHRQYRRWTEAGVWDVMLAALAEKRRQRCTAQQMYWRRVVDLSTPGSRSPGRRAVMRVFHRTTAPGKVT
jgi:transposase